MKKLDYTSKNKVLMEEIRMIDWLNNFIDSALLIDAGRRIILSLILLAIMLGLSRWQHTDLEGSFIYGFIRGLVQIVLLGFILVIIFSLQSLLLLYIILSLMIVFAAASTRRTHKYPKVFEIELAGIAVASYTIMTIVIVLGIIPVKGEYVIPLGGMVISNSMALSLIAMERIYSDLEHKKGMVEAAIALGATPRKAMNSIIRDAIRASLLPSTNRMAILGIVSIPGLMSGMIIGGMNPIIAAIYQIIIFLMIISSGFIADIIVSYYIIKIVFDPNGALKPDYSIE